MKKTHTMVMMLDPDGLPRAWAMGPDVDATRREAHRQLEIYRAKKREVGDPLADAKFTESAEMVR